LHILLAVRETSAPYNEHCLPWVEERNITVCAYFKGDVTPPASLRLFEGDGTLRGFFRTLKAALASREHDLIHIHAPHLGVLYLLAGFLNRQPAPPAVVTVHDSYQNYKTRNKLLFLPVFAGFKRVVCCSKASYQSFPGFFKLLAGDRLTFAQNGPDIERVDRSAARHSPAPKDEGTFTVVAIGRMAPVKNPYVLLEAFTRSSGPGSRLVWIGEGPLRPALMEEARRRGLADRIEFTGPIPRETVFEHLLNADLYLSTSLGEGLPLAVMEAMVAGLPVLLSDIPPHREIAEGVDFIPLVKPQDAGEFARQLGRFEAKGYEERLAIGRMCRKLVQDKFSMTAMHARYAEIYSQVINFPPALPLETPS
jgi:glycosyltransferase involved in cell wall biosynthesis